MPLVRRSALLTSLPALALAALTTACASGGAAADPSRVAAAGSAPGAGAACPPAQEWPACTLTCPSGTIDLRQQLEASLAPAAHVVAYTCEVGVDSATASVTTCRDGKSVVHELPLIRCR